MFNKKIDEDIKLEDLNKGSKYLDKLDESIEKNQTLLFFAITQLILMLVLVVGYMNLSTKLVSIVELPPKLFVDNKLIIGNASGNETYFKVWGKYILDESSNYNDKNIVEKSKDLVSMLDPELYLDYKVAIYNFRDRVLQNNMKQTFTDNKKGLLVTVSPNQNKAVVSKKGLAKQYVGKELIKEKICEYKTELEISRGRLYVTKFKTDCYSDNDKSNNSK
jgi:hypothetical protein